MMKKILCFILITAIVSKKNVYAQTGYIYVHKKAQSEIVSPDVSFSLTGGATNQNFLLNDYSNSFNIYDVGASHGIGGDGQLWAIGSTSGEFGEPHFSTGNFYFRDAGSSQWTQLTGTGTSIDGMNAGRAVYCNSLGDMYIYTKATNTHTLLWYSSVNHGGVKIVDVASGGAGGIIVGVGNDGGLYKYTGTGTDDNWTVFTNQPAGSSVVGDSAWRVDVNPSNQQVVVMNISGGQVYTLDGTNIASTRTILPILNTVPPPNNSYRNFLDIAYTDDGKLYAAATINQFVFFYTGSSWSRVENAANMSGLTGGPGGQLWAVFLKVPYYFSYPTIWTKTTDAQNVWLDDERVAANSTGNSTMIPVAPGTYTLTETVPAGWLNTGIAIYDPTNNSTGDVANHTTTINVAAGEVVHVVYSNALDVVTSIPNNCRTFYVQDFGSGPEATRSLSGYTAYHYGVINPGITNVGGDGYYLLAKNSGGWGNGALISHDGDPNGYFAIYNASFAPDDFYNQTITGLVAGQQYQMSFWIADLTPATTNIRPNVLMGVADLTNGNVLNSVSTGNVFATVWTKFSFNFTPTGTSIRVFLRNNTGGGDGNDLAIDDISINMTPPTLSDFGGPDALCSGGNPLPNYSFHAAPAGGVWSSSNPNLVTIGQDGIATPVANAHDSAMITYNYTNPVTGCESSSNIKVGVTPCIPMPVTLTSFTAQNGGNHTVLLNWTVESAKNFSHFEVERSANGSNFVKTGSIGFASGQGAYSFTDKNLPTGTYQYRLKLMDTDGSYEYSEIRAIKIGVAESAGITIYPSPAHNEIHISGLQQAATVKIYNSVGTIVATIASVNSGETISTAQLAPGMYVVHAVQNGQVVGITKFIKK